MKFDHAALIDLSSGVLEEELSLKQPYTGIDTLDHMVFQRCEKQQCTSTWSDDTGYPQQWQPLLKIGTAFERSGPAGRSIRFRWGSIDPIPLKQRVIDPTNSIVAFLRALHKHLIKSMHACMLYAH